MKHQASYVFPVRKLNEFIRRGTAIINSAIRLMEEERTGGYLCIAYSSRRGSASKGTPIYVPIAVCALGELYDITKGQNYLKNAVEKAKRLILYEHYISGAQSRDEVGDCTAGALRCDIEPLILSFDGFDEFWNEASMIVLARRMNVMSEERAQAIADVYGRGYYERLIKQFPKIMKHAAE